MNFDKLFLFDETDEPATFRVELGRPFSAFDIVRGVEEPPRSLCFRRCVGRYVFDVIGTGSPELLLLSCRVLQVLRDSRVTGWKSFPVEIRGSKGEPIRGYEGLIVTGRCGAVDWSMGKYARMPPRIPSSNPYDAWIGMYFDPESWDGSDLFMPEGTAYIIAVERVKTAVEQAEITNVRFKPLTEFERSWPS